LAINARSGADHGIEETIMTRQIRFGHPLTAMAAALLAVFGNAYAAEGDEIAELTKPSSSVSLGLGVVSKDNGRFGQYNGLIEKGGYGLADVEVVTRDDATGTWFNVRGRNLGLDSRELRFEHQVQGDWGYYIDFTQIPRFEPYTANTAITGIGTPNLTIPTTPTPGPAVKLMTERERLGLGFTKHLPGKWSMNVTFRNEEKTGARVFGRGTTGGAGNFEFLPEPIDSTTRQVEAVVSYNGDRLQLTGGYYGSMYDNKNNAIFISGGAAGLAALPSNYINPVALPPDNQSHQLHLAGGYNFTPLTRGTFKVAVARATQDDPFINVAPTAVQAGLPSNLDGRIDTTLMHFGMSSRPMPKLSVRASLRYEDRDDKTPLFQYGSGGGTNDGFNEPRSIRTTGGKAEATYALPASLSLTGGVEYAEKKRNTSPLRIVSYRETTDETTYRVELRRSMSETITGAVGLIHSDRGGSPFILTTVAGGAPGSNVIAPIHLADRKRDTVRLSANWQPTDPFSLQFRVDHSKDDYEGSRDGSGLGPREGSALNVALDAAYRFTDEWQGTAWFSHNDNKYDQSTDPTNTWQIALRSLGKSVGLGARGKLAGRFEVGADLSHSDIEDAYTQTALVGPAVPTIPDVNTQLTRLNVFVKYAVRKNSGIRVDYIYDRFKTDDWTWTTWTFTDGTTLTQDPEQKVNFLGVSYYYRF
jgi:MtrB/PioB family decaheme-associated outer membrane protein